MLVTHSVEHCPVCGEATPHSKRLLSLPVIISLALVLGGLYFLLAGPWLAGAALGFVALIVFMKARERSWHLRCERCRWNRAKEYRNTGPTLDGNTEIQIL